MKIYHEPFLSELVSLSKYYDGTPIGIDTYLKLPGVSKDDCQVEYNTYEFKVTYKDCFGNEGSKIVVAPDVDLETVNLEMKDGILFIKGEPKNNSKKLKIK